MYYLTLFPAHEIAVNVCLNVIWESAEILKSIITNSKLIDNRLKSAEVIKSINAGNSSHLMIKKAFCLQTVHYLLSLQYRMLEKYMLEYLAYHRLAINNQKIFNIN